MLFTMRETYVDRDPKMAHPVQNINHSAFRLMFEREKLSGNNFNDWFRQLKLVLRVEKKMFVTEQPIPPAPAADSVANVLAEWNALYDAHNEVACLMLRSMTPELHRQFENYSPYEMLQELRSMFEKQAGVERFNPIQTFHACKQEEAQDLTVGLILNGLTKDFARFVRNYNMHNMRKMIGELHAMLIEYENGLLQKAKTPQVMMIKGAKDDTCHQCMKLGHWKRNCPVYLAKLLKKKQAGIASSSSIFTIELFAFPNKSWLNDTGCGTHICITKQGFREARKLKQGALYLYVGIRAQVEAIGSFDLVLPNGLMICLDNCHYAPFITRGVVSVYRLVENGFVQCFTNFGISVSKNNVFYFNAIPSNGIYEIDIHDLVPNVNSIYNVSTKRAKHNLDSTYQWLCRLAHISKKRIEKLQQEWIFKSTYDESFDQCVSCLSGKMTRKSFPHRLERATDLLGIIHTDVCGPLRHVPSQGASHFITFIDDYSHYGYVYLLKHKHELTPPYTPQHNGVSGRRNRTLLDMDAKFFEKNLITQEVSGRAIDLEEIQDEDTSLFEITSKIPMEVEGFEPPQEEVIPIYRFERTHRTPTRLCLNVEIKEHSLWDLNKPTSYKVAMLDSESNKWTDAMNVEIQSTIDKMVWVLVDLPLACKTVRSKCIFKKKTDIDGIVHTYKARLVAQGYTQLYGVNYKETFSPVADIRAIRILISITAFYDYEIWKMDVKTAFLNGYLDEDMYMVQPEGFVNPNHLRKVCKLQRSIYGLKQASRSWNKRFDKEIKRFGFDQNLDEPCVYQKASGSNVTFLILYVDGIIIMGNHIPSLQSVNDYLGKCFAMKDLKEAEFILGIKIYRDRT
nr:retrotransposon protein, putative, Ty1-copia subclass [Tanacetum cinerariifolium]